MICHGCSVRHIKDNTYRIKISDGKQVREKATKTQKNISESLNNNAKL